MGKEIDKYDLINQYFCIMRKIEDVGTVLYLSESDLTLFNKEHKEFEDVDVYSFKFGTMEEIRKASIVIYTDCGEYKILKSRY